MPPGGSDDADAGEASASIDPESLGSPAPIEEDSLARAVAAAPPLPLAVRAQLATGTLVGGTYRVESELGRGAMGVVYVATDVALDRRVALKLHGSVGDDAQTSRMWREAKAMARLSDPHVVTVHEVGVHDDRVYIAMALVDGGTAADWIATPRSWSEVLAVFVQAARGLAAAHRVGLVHRDFKPSNVLVDATAGTPRVWVADFGLARAAGEREGSTESGSIGASGSPSLDERMTATGVAVGTPAYMAPEQLDGHVDHRSDQYSFFVALHEALYGVRPFSGRSIAELGAAAALGEVRAPPPDRVVPPWLRTVVLRGLRPRPEDRFVDMDAVVRALQSDPTRRRRMIIAGVVAGGVVLGLLGTIARLATREPAVDCSERAAGLDASWNDEARATVQSAMLATELPFAADTWTRVEPALDAWAGEWNAAAVHTCEGDPAIASEALRRAQALCLEHRRQAFASLLEVLAAATPKTVERAVQAVGGLPPVAPCSDVDALAADVVPPDDPELAAQVEEVRARSSRASALDRAGSFADGMTVAEAALADARALGWPPLVAETSLGVGMLAQSLGRYDLAESSMREAYATAVANGADEVAADAAVRLVFVVGYNLARHDDGLQWGFHAEAAARRVGSDPRREAGLLDGLGSVYQVKGEFDRALDYHQRALALREETWGRDHFDVARTLTNLGMVHRNRGEYDQALAVLQRALAIRQATLGPDHPAVATTLGELAGTDYARGDRDGAVEHARAALAIRERTLGPNHPELAGALANLGAFLQRRGDYDEALALQQRALAIESTALGEDHVNVAITLENIGNIHFARDELDEAESFYRRALAIRERKLGPDHPYVGLTLSNLGLVLAERDRYDEAAAFQLRALQIAEKRRGPDHPDVADALENLGNLETAAGRPAAALGYHERALAIRRKAFGTEHSDIADSEINIANALEALHRAPEAIEHLLTALTIVEHVLGPDHPRIGLVRYDLGEARLAAGDAKGAVVELEQSLAIRERLETTRADLANTRWRLARALVAAGGDRERAEALATAAHDGYGTTAGELKLRAEIEAWLRAQG